MNTKEITIEEFDEKLRIDLCKFINHVRANQYEESYTEDDWYGKFADYVLEEETK